jgi:3'(2'), 5'-bisphosphate nucleotidase
MYTYLSLAIDAALKAGQEILSIYNNRHYRLHVGMRANLTPQTNADQNSHKVIAETLAQSQLPILSEDGEDVDYETRKDWQKFWMVDPLNGTKEFIKRDGLFTVNIALIENNEAKLGVIYAPVTGEIYWGSDDTGAWKSACTETSPQHESIIKTARRLPLKGKSRNLKIISSRTFKTFETQEYFKQLRSKARKIEYVNMGSALKICLIAEGKADIYPQLEPSMEWDTAAGHAIAKAAGKEITLFDQPSTIRYNKQQLANPYFIVSSV